MSAHGEPIHSHPPLDPGIRLFRLSWGAIFAGLIIAVVVQFILAMIGLAIGFQAMDFRTGNLEGVGIGAGIWALFTAVISLFVGGLAAGHFAGAVSRINGALHGVLVWGLSMVVALWTVAGGLGTVMGGMFGVAGQTLSATVTGAAQVGAAVAGQDGLGALGEDQQIVAILEQQGMPRPQAERTAQQIRGTGQDIQLQAEQIGRRAPQVATQVSDTLATAIWWILLASILSLGAAAGGAALRAER